MTVVGKAITTFQIYGMPFSQKVYLIKDLVCDLLLGNDFLSHNTIINFTSVQFEKEKFHIEGACLKPHNYMKTLFVSNYMKTTEQENIKIELRMLLPDELEYKFLIKKWMLAKQSVMYVWLVSVRLYDWFGLSI